MTNKIIFSGDFVPDERIIKNPIFFSSLNEICDSRTIHITNLECPLTNQENRKWKTGPNLRAKPEMVLGLIRAGVDYACLANNHIKDYGTDGILDTIKYCNDSKIETLGAGITQEEAKKYIFIQSDSYNIAIVNYCEQEYNGKSKDSYGANLIDEISLFYDIISLKKKVNKIILVVHWGREMYSFPTPEQQRLARYIIDLGVDLIVGHHSHICGAYELYKNKTIIYSLGNFYFNEAGQDEAWYKGVLCQVEFLQNDFQIKIYPIKNTEEKLMIGEHTRLNDKENIHLVYASEDTVEAKWKNIVESNYKRQIENVLNFGRAKKFFYRFIAKKLQQTQVKRLLILRNQLRCRTHFEYLKSSLEKYFQEE